MDFRDAAVQASRSLLQSNATSKLGELKQSAFVPVPGGRARHKRYEYVNLAIAGASCLITLSGFLLLVGFDLVWVRLLGLLVSVFAFVLLLTQRKLRALQMTGYLRNREGSLLPQSSAATMVFSIEDAATYQTTKVVPEDAGVALLDADHERILIEGFRYRYIIYGRDVTKLETLPVQGISGALLSCQIGECRLDLALGLAGHGMLDSLVQAFSPGATAKEASYRLRCALGLDKTSSHPVPPASTPPPIPDQQNKAP